MGEAAMADNMVPMDNGSVQLLSGGILLLDISEGICFFILICCNHS
uniref:Uncharacterized protein n=1 Tax=Oryza meridionalis TaxID=40149 RepID=A0A0E0EBZ5_9ORYZ